MKISYLLKQDLMLRWVSENKCHQSVVISDYKKLLVQITILISAKPAQNVPIIPTLSASMSYASTRLYSLKSLSRLSVFSSSASLWHSARWLASVAVVSLYLCSSPFSSSTRNQPWLYRAFLFLPALRCGTSTTLRHAIPRSPTWTFSTMAWPLLWCQRHWLALRSVATSCSFSPHSTFKWC